MALKINSRGLLLHLNGKKYISNHALDISICYMTNIMQCFIHYSTLNAKLGKSADRQLVQQNYCVKKFLQFQSGTNLKTTENHFFLHNYTVHPCKQSNLADKLALPIVVTQLTFHASIVFLPDAKNIRLPQLVKNMTGLHSKYCNALIVI